MNHFHDNIQGWFNCENLYRRSVEAAQNGSVFVEVGVWKGKSSAFMGVEILNSKKKIEFYAVDHFQGSPEHQDSMSIKSGTLKEQCYKNLEPVMGVVRMLPVPSLTAAAMFKDGSIDMVYIDGSHEYEDVKNDIQAWLPKVKNGGILAGDDYGVGNHLGVKQAVDELLPLAKQEGLIWVYEKSAGMV